MRAPRPLYLPTLVALGLSVAACGTDPVKGLVPKFEFPFPNVDAGTDAATDVTCSGGKEVGSTEERTRFEAASVPAGQTCAQETQSRTCEEDGTWSDWSGNFKIVACEVEADSSCTEGSTESRETWDGTVGETDAGLPVVECLKETQTRTCTGGTWGEWSGPLKFPECPQIFAACDGKPHLSEETRQRWGAATVNPGQTCAEETQRRTCNDGEWTNWSGTFVEMSCTVLQFANCGNKPHLSTETRTMYEATEAAAGQACVSEEQTRTCNDGVWSDWEGEEDVPFTKEFCDPAGQKRCAVPGGGTVAHDAKHTYRFYPNATVPYPQTCVPDTQEVTCNNGTLPPYTGGATHPSCSQAAPAGCADGGTTKPHNSTKTQVRYENERVPHGSSCKSESQTSTCDNGTWSAYVGAGNFQYSECKKHCEGGDHGATQTRTRYQDSSVAAGQVCVKQDQTRTCTDGTWGPGPLAGGWNGGAIYDEDTCRVRKRDCSLPNNEKLFDGESLTRLRYKTAFPTTACEYKTQERLCTDGTLGNWTPANLDYDLLACVKVPPAESGVSSCRYVVNNKPRCIEYDEPVGPLPGPYCEVTLGGTWDDTRGCPTAGAVAMCKQSDTIEYHWIEEEKNAVCLIGTWTVL